MTQVPESHESLRRLIANLKVAHGALLSIHKALLDHERARYEQKYGPILTPGDVLQLVISHPWFAWLRKMSGLIVQIDEFISSKDPPVLSEGEALLTLVRKLLSTADDGSEFQREYHRALQESPEVAFGQGQWKLALIHMDKKT